MRNRNWFIIAIQVAQAKAQETQEQARLEKERAMTDLKNLKENKNEAEASKSLVLQWIFIHKEFKSLKF